MNGYLENLEKEFSPSAWVKRFSTHDEAIEHHKKVVMEGTKYARETLQCELDISYGPGPRSKLDVYGTDLPLDAPIFVIIHGGYWQLKEYTKELGTYGVVPLVRAGCRVFVADYEMCPTVTLEELVENAFQCITYTLNQAKTLGAKSISFLGHSAGGHLVVSQFQPSRFVNLPHKELIRDVYLVSGVFDLRDLRIIEAVNKNNLLSLNDNNVTTLSPILTKYDLTPVEGQYSIRFTVVITDNESQSYHTMAQNMEDALKNGGAQVNYLLVQNSDHFEIVEQLNDENAKFTKIVLNNLSHCD